MDPYSAMLSKIFRNTSGLHPASGLYKEFHFIEYCAVLFSPGENSFWNIYNIWAFIFLLTHSLTQLIIPSMMCFDSPPAYPLLLPLWLPLLLALALALALALDSLLCASGSLPRPYLHPRWPHPHPCNCFTITSPSAPPLYFSPFTLFRTYIFFLGRLD